MLAPNRATVAMSPPPMPPAPMPATFSRSLGGVCPGPPNTCRGTIVNAAAAPAAVERKARREGLASAADRCLVVMTASLGKRTGCRAGGQIILQTSGVGETEERL